MMEQKLQVTAFPKESINGSKIVIVRHKNFIQVMQDDQILGSINLEQDELEIESFNWNPMIIITVLGRPNPIE